MVSTIVIQHEKSQFVKKTFLGWSLWTFIISVADISLSILLSLDYGYFVGLYPEQIEKGNYGVSTYFICNQISQSRT